MRRPLVLFWAGEMQSGEGPLPLVAVAVTWPGGGLEEVAHRLDGGGAGEPKNAVAAGMRDSVGGEKTAVLGAAAKSVTRAPRAQATAGAAGAQGGARQAEALHRASQQGAQGGAASDGPVAEQKWQLPAHPSERRRFCRTSRYRLASCHIENRTSMHSPVRT
ncbi:MAG: hypothetical protein NTY46_10640 [Candidatus Sumerlaeota bacterium]|nr:hypothetical protein [Candidatus Sumerlaeota bacterium]